MQEHGNRVEFDSLWIHDLRNAFFFSTYHTLTEFVYKLPNRRNLILEFGTGDHLLYDLLTCSTRNRQSLDIDKDKKRDYWKNSLGFGYASGKSNILLPFGGFAKISLQTFEEIFKRAGSSRIEHICFLLPVADFQLLKLEIKLHWSQILRLLLFMPSGRAGFRLPRFSTLGGINFFGAKAVKGS